MSVFLILIGPPRNSQCKLQSPQAALDCAQSPNFNSLRFLLWLTDKEHDEGHWRKRARIEEGAENLNRKHWASPKLSQLSSCWFLAWKTVSSPAPVCYMLLVTNQSKAASLKCTCTGQEKHYTVFALGKKAEIWGIHQGSWDWDVYWTFSSSVFLLPGWLLSPGRGCCILFHSTGDSWLQAEFLQLHSSCFWGPRAVHWKSSFFPPFLLTLSSKEASEHVDFSNRKETSCQEIVWGPGLKEKPQTLWFLSNDSKWYHCWGITFPVHW